MVHFSKGRSCHLDLCFLQIHGLAVCSPLSSVHPAEGRQILEFRVKLKMFEEFLRLLG
jgi:hypothetical protein